MAEKVKSNYSISTDEGKTYSQMEIEEILSSFEKLYKSTEAAKDEIFTCQSTDDGYSSMVAECECDYGKIPHKNNRHQTRRSTIKIDDAVDFLMECGTYEMAVYVSLMFHRILGDRIPERLKRKLDAVVRDLTDRRIVPVINQYNLLSNVNNK